MKYIILVLFFVTACKNKAEHNTQTDLSNSEAQSTQPTNASSTDRNLSATPLLSYKGVTKTGLECIVTAPKQAAQLTQFQLSFKIANNEAILESFSNINVVKDMHHTDSIYYSEKTEPSVSLKFESGQLVYFTIWKEHQNKHSCYFKKLL